MAAKQKTGLTYVRDLADSAHNFLDAVEASIDSRVNTDRLPDADDVKLYKELERHVRAWRRLSTEFTRRMLVAEAKAFRAKMGRN